MVDLLLTLNWVMWEVELWKESNVLNGNILKLQVTWALCPGHKPQTKCKNSTHNYSICVHPRAPSSGGCSPLWSAQFFFYSCLFIYLPSAGRRPKSHHLPSDSPSSIKKKPREGKGNKSLGCHWIDICKWCSSMNMIATMGLGEVVKKH